MDIRQSLLITTNNAFQTLGTIQNPRANAVGNLSVESPTVEQMNVAIGATGSHQNMPFIAAHPSLAGKRNTPRCNDEEDIVLGPGRETRPRQHASPGTMLRAKR